jgi:hypothetical protein
MHLSAWGWKNISLCGSHEGLIATRHKGQIVAGTHREKEIDERLRAASIIVLLLSSDFVASDACMNLKTSGALERYRYFVDTGFFPHLIEGIAASLLQ